MTEEELIRTFEKYIILDNCFTIEVRDILITYRNAGGQQETAQKLIEQLTMNFSNNELIQDRAYDILDIVTSWCNPEMRVWD